ncbi:MAG: four helix bundle protein [Candidatus Methanosuratincola sp.]
MDEETLKARTKTFALRVIKLVESLPKGMVGEVLGKQLLRSATSVAANYRAACRARSQAEFVSKMSIVVEEADESLLWLELISEAGVLNPARLQDLIKEANELTSIFVVSRATARKHVRK